MLIDTADAVWRTRNIGRLLHTAKDLFVRDKLRVVHAGGFGLVTGVHMALVQNLGFGGARLTVLAARARMTKQAMAELVAKAEALGLVERRPDPVDGRARIVAFTPDGVDMMERLRTGVAAAERRMTAVTGAGFVEAMKERLSAYIVASVPAFEAAIPDVESGASWRTHNAGRILSTAAATFSRDLLGALDAGGFAAVKDVHLSLIRNLDEGGTRLTIIAARAQMTKPAMQELVDRMEALGLVARRPDPDDRRAKIVGFTPDGLRMLLCLREGVEAAERRMAALANSAWMDELRNGLAAYVATIAPLMAGRVRAARPEWFPTPGSGSAMPARSPVD